MTNAKLPTQKHAIFWCVIIFGTLVFINLIHPILLPFVLGMFTAYFLDPAADRLEKLGCSRTLATVIMTVGFFLGIVLLSLLIIPVVAGQLSGLIAALPGYITQFTDRYSSDITIWLGDLPGNYMDSIKSAASDFSGLALKYGGAFIASIFQSGMAIVNILSLILVTPVVAFYLLRDWDRLVAHLDTYLPRKHAETIREQLRIIDRTLAGFVRGQLTVCFILGVFYAISLSIVGLKFGAVIGLLTGFLVIFPYVGMALGSIIGIMVALFQFGNYHDVGIVIAIFVAGQMVESNFITPKLVGQRVGLHPVWIIFGMLAGATLFGFVGVLLAVPTTAVIGVLIRFAAEKYLHSRYYKG